MTSDAILDMAEDLLDGDYAKSIDANKKAKRKPHPQQRKDLVSPTTLESLVHETAKVLQINYQELSEWLENSSAPKEVQRRLLKVAKRLVLNPLLAQLDWEHYPEHGYEVFIPIDGWITLIHRESKFQGMVFQQSTEMEYGIPIWMECSIYRSDLIQPITVREYFAELKTDHPIWQQMPRRMMRHKTLQQGARLAFGIYLPELRDRMPILATAEKSKSDQRVEHISAKQLLKEKLQTESTQ